MKQSESDTRAKFIDGALKLNNWEEDYIIREFYFTDGRKIGGNKRGQRYWADYILRYNNLNLAVIEAKRIGKEATDGLQQVIDYADKLKVRFAYTTNGKDLYEFDMESGKGKYVDSFPTPEELYGRQFEKRNELKEKLLAEGFHIVGNFKPRYYQEIAVNRTLEAIADGKKRVLLTLATGTGKTVIAFQIVHKLFEAKWNIDGVDRRPRVLFLADRNVLADQAINTFNDPYEKDLIKINGEEIRRRNGKVPTNAHIFFAIYQALAEKENISGYYKEYPKDFFDLIVIDECHRGSANEAGTWRNILDHFDTAVHVGMTATPKRDDNVDTYRYFGKPVYVYSLKEGISDGFLTPYKVKRIRTNIDEYVPTNDDEIMEGQLDKNLYVMEDFNRSITIPEREALIAKTILENIGSMDKTIIFCVDQGHARIMRDAINTYKNVRDPYYCVRITSDEGILGRQLLERFQDNDKDIPVILTSSQMLTTGVDARNVRNIVLVRTINSMLEFKQIVGRGTRVFEGKDFFTIIDFTGATNKFYDDEWDGEPEEPTEEIEVAEDLAPIEEFDRGKELQEESELTDADFEEEPPKRKTIVKLSNGRNLKIIDLETRYIDEDGRPLSANQFLEKLLGVIPNLFANEEKLRKIWSKPESRKELLEKLRSMGIDEEQLKAMQKMFEAEDSDIFDILAHIAFNADMRTRQERAQEAKIDQEVFERTGSALAKDFLFFILERYEKDGIDELDRDSLPSLIKISGLGTINDASKAFGGSENLLESYYKLQESIYKK
jgi:type I restriction enzyme R subunit